MSDLKGFSEAIVGELKTVADAGTIIGEPIISADGTTAIPVSRISVGFGSGGSEGKTEASGLAGGGAGGVSIIPVAFLIMSPTGGVSLLQIAGRNQFYDKALNLLPGLVQQLSDFIGERIPADGGKRKSRKQEEETSEFDQNASEEYEKEINQRMESSEEKVNYTDLSDFNAPVDIN